MNAVTIAIVGQKVRLPTDCQCGVDVAVIGPSDGKYAATLTCSCGRGRGFLTEFVASWMEALAAKFGAPAAITLRHAPIPPIPAERPPENAGTSREKSND
jgi:hypothetical protein